MSKTDHLAKAKDYIAKGEDYYRKAAEEIVAAKREDPALTDSAVAASLGRSRTWVSKLISWVENGDRDTATPFGGEQQEARREASVTRRVAKERPEILAEAIAHAPAEAQRKIADELVKAPATERSLKKVAEGPKRQPRIQKPVETRLSEATFSLWEVGEALMDEAPGPEEKLRMLASAEKAQRLASGIVGLLNTGEFEDAFRELMEEVGAEV